MLMLPVIMPQEQPKIAMANRHTPYAIWVDLYMREFILPGEMTQIPRQGYQGSYAVIAIDLAEDKDDHLAETDDTTKADFLTEADHMTEADRMAETEHQTESDHMSKAVRSISAIKVINGEERDTFSGQVAANTMEEQRKLLHRFHMFAGYLPLVGHAIEEKIIPVLSESYGVLLGIPFSNRVIDTKLMARNHLPGELRYTLDALADTLGIEAHADTELESRCRKTWKLYCRMERSEL